MGHPRSRISQHESVLEYCQLEAATVRKEKILTVLRCALDGDRHSLYDLCYQEILAVSRHVMDAIEGRMDYASEGTSIRAPVSATSANLHQNHAGSAWRRGMPTVEELSAKDAGPHPLLKFLQSQPRKALSRLYQRPSSCLCIFRFLLRSRSVKPTDAWDDC